VCPGYSFLVTFAREPISAPKHARGTFDTHAQQPSIHIPNHIGLFRLSALSSAFRLTFSDPGSIRTLVFDNFALLRLLVEALVLVTTILGFAQFFCDFFRLLLSTLDFEVIQLEIAASK
jgi:hypothetical protein